MFHISKGPKEPKLILLQLKGSLQTNVSQLVFQIFYILLNAVLTLIYTNQSYLQFASWLSGVQ